MREGWDNRRKEDTTRGVWEVIVLEKNHELFLIANSINPTESLQPLLFSRLENLNRHQKSRPNNFANSSIPDCRDFFSILSNCREQRGREPFPWNDKMKEGWNWRENNVERLNEQIENVPLMDYDVVASRDRDVNHGEDACANSDNENSSVCVYVCMCAYIWTGMLNRIHRLHVLCEWGWCVKSIYAPVRHIIFHDVKHRIFWHSIHLVRSIYIEKGGRDDSRHGQETRKEIPSRVYTVGFTRVLNRKFI